MTINDLKRMISVEEILQKHDVKHKGSKWICPFHEDSEPSFVVRSRADKGQTWKCFGCGKYGDVLDLIALLEDRTFKEILSEYGIVEHRQPPRPHIVPTKPKWKQAVGLIRSANDYTSLTAATIIYVNTIKETS